MPGGVRLLLRGGGCWELDDIPGGCCDRAAVAGRSGRPLGWALPDDIPGGLDADRGAAGAATGGALPDDIPGCPEASWGAAGVVAACGGGADTAGSSSSDDDEEFEEDDDVEEDESLLAAGTGVFSASGSSPVVILCIGGL